VTQLLKERAHVRYHVVASIEILAEDGEAELGVFFTHDLSEGGAFCEADLEQTPVRAGQLLPVALGFSDEDEAPGPPPPPIVVTCTARVVRVQESSFSHPGGFALQFEGLDDENRELLRVILAHGSPSEAR
jgi:hypothetical protein